jgi:hypothetical protein
MFPPEHTFRSGRVGEGSAGPLPLNEDSRSSEHGEGAQPTSKLPPNATEYPPEALAVASSVETRRMEAFPAERMLEG